MPRGLAIVATPGAERQADEIRRARETKEIRGVEHANELKTALENLGEVSLPVHTAGDTGKLFGSVTAADVVSAIKKAGGPNLDKRTVQLPKAHIKSVGTHPIVVRAAHRGGSQGVAQRRRRVIRSPSNPVAGRSAGIQSPGWEPAKVSTRAFRYIVWRTRCAKLWTAKHTGC